MVRKVGPNIWRSRQIGDDAVVVQSHNPGAGWEPAYSAYRVGAHWYIPYEGDSEWVREANHAMSCSHGWGGAIKPKVRPGMKVYISGREYVIDPCKHTGVSIRYKGCVDATVLGEVRNPIGMYHYVIRSHRDGHDWLVTNPIHHIGIEQYKDRYSLTLA